MVFLIQNSQNRDSAAIQVKLDEIIRTSQVHNRFVGIEHLSDDQLDDLRCKTEEKAALEAGEDAVAAVGEKADQAAQRVSAP